MSSGQDDGVGPIGPKNAPDPLAGTESPGAVEGSEGPQGSEPVETVAPVGPAGAEASDAAIAQALQTGKIDATTAKDLLIDAVAREQLGADASPQAVEALKIELAEALEGDPAFDQLL